MQTDQLKQVMSRNAETIRNLHARVRETFKSRGYGIGQRRAWEAACTAFHVACRDLSFPGGDAAIGRLPEGNPDDIEAALCFLELRPYFFRSGYMFRKILRKVKRAPLPEYQAARLKTVLEKLEEWKRQKAKKA